MFEVAFSSIIGVKLGRTRTSFRWNQANQSSSLKFWKWGLMMAKVLFIIRSLTTGWKSGTCQIMTLEDFNTTLFPRSKYTIQDAGKHATKYLIRPCPPQPISRFTSISEYRLCSFYSPGLCFFPECHEQPTFPFAVSCVRNSSTFSRALPSSSRSNTRSIWSVSVEAPELSVNCAT